MRLLLILGISSILTSSLAAQAVLEVRLLSENITGLSDGERMFDSGLSTPIPWPDSSGNGRDAAGTDIFTSPFYDAAEVGVFGNQPFVRAQSGDYLVGATPTLADWGMSSFVVAQIDQAGAVFSLGNSGSSVGYILLSATADGNLTVGWRGTNFSINFTSSTGLNVFGEEHLFAVDFRAKDDIEVFVDGVSVLVHNTATSSSVGITSIDRYGIGVNARSTLSDGNGIQVAAAEFYTGALAAGQMDSISQSLADTYGVNLIPEPSHYAMLFGAAMLFGLMIRRRV
ncbi:PEP-CTERM sorting domain-containing protein [Cerasicoccus maritimus]|uniref:PEP-CTERM sorting domain-containing protein n=1 Tax=Cerasicoccus maritimus TaxID=490089 RepID=UPI002852DB26|nr:PEP-CTERM sorting domain-containing protein [Cerasicoccus maritimus]